jgi:hydrogenase-4 component F
MRLAFAFILVGYGTSRARANARGSDAHSQAPSPVSGLLSSVLLKCALSHCCEWACSRTSPSAATSGQLAHGLRDREHAVALPFILVQGDVKRLLAYSSVENVGIIALAAGIGGPIAAYAAVLHMVAHSLTKSSLFFAAGSLVQAYGTRRLHRLRSIVRLTPGLGVAFIGAAIAVSGFPPFAMFVSEYGLLSGAFDQERGAIAVVGMALAALAAAALLFQVVGTSYAHRRGGRAVGKVPALALGTAFAPLLLATWIAVAPPPPVRDLLTDAAAVMEV